MDKNDIIHLIRQHYQTLESFGIVKIGIFGSALNDTMNYNSDIDLFIEFRNPVGFKFNQLCEYL